MAYISSAMSDSDINSILGLRQNMDAQRQQTPLDELLARSVAQGQRAAPQAAGVPGMDSTAPGWQNPAASTPAPPTPGGPPPSAAQGGGQVPGLPGSANVGSFQQQMADPLARLSRSSAWEGLPEGASQQLTGAEALALRRQSNPSYGTPADTISMLLGTGPYAGMMPGQYLPPALSNLSPAERIAMISQMNGMSQTGINQQAESRLQAQLFGANGQQGTMGLGNRAQQLAEDQHSFASNQSVANMNAYRQLLMQRMQSGQPLTQEESQNIQAMLPQMGGAPGAAGAGASPLSPGTGPTPPTNQTPLGPGFTVGNRGGAQVQHPWAAIGNQLDTTWRQAMAASGQAGPTATANGDTITAFVHALANNGVSLTPENSLAVRQFILSKLNPTTVDQWWNTSDSVMPDLGLGRETPAAAARRMLRQSAGIGASSSNSGVPFWQRLLNFGDLLGNRQYQ